MAIAAVRGDLSDLGIGEATCDLEVFFVIHCPCTLHLYAGNYARYLDEEPKDFAKLLREKILCQ